MDFNHSIRAIDLRYPFEVETLDALLQRSGLHRDRNLDYTVGVFDENDQLLATGSCFHNTLRCLAVDEAHRGDGLLNAVVSELVSYAFRRGFTDLFVYTKCEAAPLLADLGFYEIVRVDDRVVFMENRKGRFDRYCASLLQDAAPVTKKEQRQGAVVLNANPFTNGHRYLIETAAAACDRLHVFIVSEDASLVPFVVRERLIRDGTADLNNLAYHQTGDYLISGATFPSYFLREDEQVIQAHAALDARIFLRIAQTLGISCRYVGEEPHSVVTGLYNRTLRSVLEPNGCALHEIPRLCRGGAPVSASAVRRILQTDSPAAIAPFVPKSTLAYFTSDEAEPVLQAIRACKNVEHY